jgi:repressor LexA
LSRSQAGILASASGGRLQPDIRFFELARAESLDTPAPGADADVPVAGLQIDAYFVDQPSRTVLLSMKDDSMSAAGLLPGDTLVVKRQAPAQPGDVVVAVVDRKFTVRYLAHDRNGFFLKAGNSAYVPSLSSEDLEIHGRVVASFRKYPNASRS